MRTEAEKPIKHEELVARLRELLEKDVFLDSSEKKRLLENIEEVPSMYLSDLISRLEKKDDLSEKYITAAIKEDSSIPTEMKKKTQNLKKKIHELKESEESGEVESELEEALKQI